MRHVYVLCAHTALICFIYSTNTIMEIVFQKSMPDGGGEGGGWRGLVMEGRGLEGFGREEVTRNK